jgi:hypothetical protein
MNYSKYARHAYSRTKVRPRGGRRRARSAGSGSADVVYLMIKLAQLLVFLLLFAAFLKAA